MVEFVSLEREHIDMIVNKTINEINEMLELAEDEQIVYEEE